MDCHIDKCPQGSAHPVVGRARKCWLRVLILFLLTTTANLREVCAHEAGFVPLFNGSNLDGWTGAKDGYVGQDGVITCLLGTTGNLFTDNEYANFILRFEFQLTPGANNGIGIRAPLIGDAAYEGMEIQILDDGAEKYSQLAPYQYHGSAYGVAPSRRGSLKPTGQWNQEEIRLSGRHLIVFLNGTTILDVDIDHAAPNGQAIDGRSHPGLARHTGHIGFLGHGDCVAFRDIRIRDLDSSPMEDTSR